MKVEMEVEIEVLCSSPGLIGAIDFQRNQPVAVAFGHQVYDRQLVNTGKDLRKKDFLCL